MSFDELEHFVEFGLVEYMIGARDVEHQHGRRKADGLLSTGVFHRGLRFRRYRDDDLFEDASDHAGFRRTKP